MCFSAMVEENYRSFLRKTGASISIEEFARLFKIRGERRTLIPKAMEAPFLLSPETPADHEIGDLIRAYQAQQRLLIEAKVFEQKTRLNTATRSLQVKVTKKAQNDVRVATNKVAQNLEALNDLRRTELESRGSRIYPDWYALVLVSEGGRRLVRPMRYRLRAPGKPPDIDRKLPGTYCARYDNLEGYWKGMFGRTHGIILATAFFENVALHDKEGRELRPGEEPTNVILEFKPATHHEMWVACIYAKWGHGDDELLSFATITVDPPPEVAAAGHNRCIVPIKRENADAWLNPDPADLAAQYAILDDRERPYYEHRQLAA